MASKVLAIELWVGRHIVLKQESISPGSNVYTDDDGATIPEPV